MIKEVDFITVISFIIIVINATLNYLKEQYKTALLSNTEIPAMNCFSTQRYNMFSELIFSCREGTRKPEKKIYEIAIKRLRVKSEETVFIDDSEEYVNGAKTVGLNVILFKSSEQVKKELSIIEENK